MVVGYLAVWGITQLLGAPAVRLAAQSEYLPADIPIRWSECRAFAVGPLLVTSTYGWRGKAALQGAGGTTLYVWIGRPFPIWKFDKWMA